MKNRFLQILIWLGLIIVFTSLTFGVGLFVLGMDQSTAALKWMQFIQTVAVFLLPPIIGAWIWDEQNKPLAWLHMDKGADGRTFFVAVLIMLCAIPAINLMMDLNGRIVFPKSLDFIEQYLRDKEEQLALLTERFMRANNVEELVINIALMALMPAIAEELSFRGVLLQIISPLSPTQSRVAKHVAVWVSAIIFSAIHMQFYGFFARMFMGAVLGYMFVWTGSIWVPIVMHFTNNTFAVLAFYFFDESAENGINYADTLGAGTTWWLGVLSLITVVVLMILTSRGQLRYDRRTRIQ